MNPHPIFPEGYTTSRSRNDTRQTNLLRDVAFNRHSMNDGNHNSPYDNGVIQIGTDGIAVKLIQGINEEDFKKVQSMCIRATTGIDVGKDIGDDIEWEEMLQGGLQASLETQVVCFAVSGVSRACTHQLVRTRKAGFHQQSQRATFYGSKPETRMPESVWLNPKAREAFINAKAAADDAYRIACEQDISYQDARYVLNESTTNFIMCEYSIREFINVFAYRGCSMFNWEIVHVVREMRKLLIDAHQWLAPYIKISCEKTGQVCQACDNTGWEQTDAYEEAPCSVCKGTGRVNQKCTFQGWEEVEGQCDFPQAKEAQRTFVSKRHSIKQLPQVKA